MVATENENQIVMWIVMWRNRFELNCWVTAEGVGMGKGCEKGRKWVV